MSDFESHVKLTVETESKGKIRCSYRITFQDSELNWETVIPAQDGESVLQLQTRLAEKLRTYLRQILPAEPAQE